MRHYIYIPNYDDGTDCNLDMVLDRSVQTIAEKWLAEIH